MRLFQALLIGVVAFASFSSVSYAVVIDTRTIVPINQFWIAAGAQLVSFGLTGAQLGYLPSSAKLGTNSTEIDEQSNIAWPLGGAGLIFNGLGFGASLYSIAPKRDEGFASYRFSIICSAVFMGLGAISQTAFNGFLWSLEWSNYQTSILLGLAPFMINLGLGASISVWLPCVMKRWHENFVPFRDAV